MLAEMENYAFLTPLFKYLSQFHPLSEGFMEQHEKNCQLISVKKHKYILSPLDNNNSVYFLIKGLVRGFVKEDKKDISTWFGFEHELISAIRPAAKACNYSIEYLQALEDCQLIRIPITFMEKLCTEYTEGLHISKKILEINYYAASERAILARIPNAMERYKKMEILQPNLNRIPGRYLGSYLGIRLETLSRIRNKTTRPKSLLAS